MADEPVTAWTEPLAWRARRWMRRNRTAVTTGTVAILVALIGTTAILAVQTSANRNLNAANIKLSAANDRLEAANKHASARFRLAQEAVRLFHNEVSEEILLRQPQFTELRTKLLRGARDYQDKLEAELQPPRGS
jgi:eukaryotic-like serine/threonine-protein kinase